MTVHLIHIGFPKTGSTYLQSWFASHPGIAYRRDQIMACDSVYQIVDQAIAVPPAMPRVTSCEDFAAPSRDHREWDGMPAAQIAVCDTLHALFPAAHILIVTRGWRGILESGYAELVRFGRTERFDAFVRSPAILDLLPQILDYDRLIALYRRRFEGRVIVLPYELLRDDPRAFLGVIETAMGVAAHRGAADAENVRLLPTELRWYPSIARAIGRLPVGTRLRGRLTGLHIRAIRSGRLRRVVETLDRWRPPSERPAATLPEPVVEKIRRGAAALVTESWHQRYAQDYLATQ